MRRLLFAASLATALVALPVHGLRAQETFVKVTPGSRTVAGQTTITLTIAWCAFQTGGAHMLDLDTRVVKVNGQTVSDYNLQFDAAGCGFTGSLSDEALYTSQVDVDVSTPDATISVLAEARTYWNYLYSDYESYQTPKKRRAMSIASKAGFISVEASTSASASFTITNLGNARDTFPLSASCAGVSSCSLSPSSVAIDAGATATATVSYVAPSNGASGLVTLRATGERMDSAWTDVRGIATPASGTVIVGASPGDTANWDRSLCIAASIGERAAMECGDLRLAHALPGVRTLGRQRTPVLVYSSHTISPRPIIQADVTLPSSWGEIPASVSTCIMIAGVSRGCTSWSGSNWGAYNVTRRIAIAADSTLATGAWSYSLQIMGSGGQSLPAVTGVILVVNRNASPFGAGWWLAGLAHMVIMADGRRVIVEGDGSARSYVVSSGNTFIAPNPARPDTMICASGTCVQKFPNGASVSFADDVTGRQIATTDRFGKQTTFSYDGNGCLTQIAWPTASGTTIGRLVCSSGMVTRYIAPGRISGDTTRYVRWNTTGARLDSLTDPDGSVVRFGYSGSSNYLATSRTNQRNKTTTFTFGSGRRLTGATYANGTSIQLKAAEASAMNVAQPFDSIVTSIDGPRTDVADVTQFWINRYGAPVRTKDAAGRETFIRYSSQWPALADSTVSPARLSTRSTYNSRGLVDSVTVFNPNGDNQNATTHYTWHSTWNAVIAVRSPTGLLDSTGIDGATGNAIWQQRYSSTYRANYYWNSSAWQLDSVKTPLGFKESYAYSALGNPRRIVNAKGYTTWTHEDSAGRVIRTVSPKDTTGLDSTSVHANGTSSYTYYSVMDRVDSTVSTGPRVTVGATGRSHPPMWVAVGNTYDPAGNRLSTVRRYLTDTLPGYGVTSLTSSWQYDDLNRVTYTSSPEAGISNFYKDAAGNDTAIVTPRSLTIRQKFDAANRMVRRALPSVSYSTQSSWGYGFSFPTYDPTAGVCIGVDTAYFAFDASGNMRAAENGSAWTRRTYLPSGAVKVDSQMVRTYPTSAPAACGGHDRHPGARVVADFSAHTYAIQYAYDLAGRRSTLTYPTVIAPCTSGPCNTRYSYSPSLGTLDTVTGPLNAPTRFTYDADGRLTQVTHPGGPTTSYGYDAGGNRTSQSANFLYGSRGVGFGYDAAGRILSASISVDGNSWGTSNTLYGPLGAVVYNNNVTGNTGFEEYRTDPLGNRIWHRSYNYSIEGSTWDRSRTFYFDGNARLLAIGGYSSQAGANDSTHLTFDETGSTVKSRVLDPIPGNTWSIAIKEAVSYYDSDQKLRFQDQAVGPYNSQAGAVFEEHRYDALGRRVLTRTRCHGSGATDPTCQNTLERVIWDGDQTLGEIRAKGADADSGYFEYDTETGSGLGRTAYVHGGTLDAPLVAYRFGAPGSTSSWVGVTPHADWQGAFETGTWATGAYVGQETKLCTSGTSDCPAITWLGGTTRLDGDRPSRASNSPPVWMGGLLSARTDASGLQYRRNRYYDPATGRFTQADPIGLAGGLNAYGFASGDPVNFSDPHGLSACPDTQICPDEWARDQVHKAVSTLGDFGNALKAGIKSAGRELLIHGGLALATGGLSAEAEGTVTLFRAVSRAEAADIASTGVFRAVGSSAEGKYFATSAADAAKWGQKLVGDGYQVVSAQFPAGVAKQMHSWARLDGIGAAKFATMDQLKSAIITLLK